MLNEVQLYKASEILRKSKYVIAFTGAGISVESGIPPFRGEHGIWEKYDPAMLEIGYFFQHPLQSWQVIREIFYAYFGDAKVNKAHVALAKMEQKGLLRSIITQNIDNLHQQAGSKSVFEFHGNSQRLVCTKCHADYPPASIDIDHLPPTCGACSGLIKPDFIFFGENIPFDAYQNSVDAAEKADAIIVIGSTGEVMPAAQMPYIAKQNGAVIIEVNTEPSKFTHAITDFYLEDKATEVMEKLYFAVYGEDLL